MQVLLIDDGCESARILSARLDVAGFRTTRVGSAAEALRSPVRDNISAVLVENCHQSNSSAEVVVPLRAGGFGQPLIVLSALADWRERVASLDAGADDFVVKPVHSEEVAARLRAVIRRTEGATSNRVSFGDILLDLKAQCAWRGAECLALTRSEFLVLRLLVLAPDSTVTKAQIMRALWQADAAKSSNAIEVQVGRLRRKLGQARIRTVRGIGYRAVRVLDVAVDEAELLACCQKQAVVDD